MDLILYNTKTKEKEKFTPQTANTVTMYNCGPTVYNYAHIGNLRQYVFADVLRRTLERLGHEVTQVMNITNVGHLVSDGDSGEDKMTKALIREGKEKTIAAMEELGERYTQAFLEDIKQLGIKTPHHLPRASKHIAADIAIITTLEEKGYTYTTSDGIYFNTEKLSTYGKLGGMNETDTPTQERIAKNSEKKHPRDFALWKFNSEIGWESPWGQGFPGWHIECSGMAMEYLGETIDIHTGGVDHISVHHNNEIAQSETATGKEFARFWLHGAFLTMAGEKIAKSVGNVVYLHTLMERGYHPLAYRYLITQAHYRSPLAFSWEALEHAQKALEHILATYTILMQQTTEDEIQQVSEEDITQWQQAYTEALCNDLNTPQAMSVLHEVIGDTTLAPEQKVALLHDFDTVLGLQLHTLYERTTDVPQEIQALQEKRMQARKQKDWDTSDALRDQIQQAGYQIHDIGETTILQQSLAHLAQELAEETQRT